MKGRGGGGDGSTEDPTERLARAGRRAGTGVGASTEPPRSENLVVKLSLLLLSHKLASSESCVLAIPE